MLNYDMAKYTLDWNFRLSVVQIEKRFVINALKN